MLSFHLHKQNIVQYGLLLLLLLFIIHIVLLYIVLRATNNQITEHTLFVLSFHSKYLKYFNKE